MGRRENHRTALFIALRYLFSKKQHNIINVISMVSMVGIMVSAAALVIVLSVFNGMGGMIKGWFNAFNPDFRITLAEGKSFDVDAFPKAEIAALPYVAKVNEVVSDMVLVTYQGQQELLRLKGVDPDYLRRGDYANMLVDGTLELQQGDCDGAVLGTGAAGKLLVNLNSYDLLKLYYPKRTKKNLANPAEAFNTRYLTPAGVFASNTDNDVTHLFCSIDFARNLMQYEGQATEMEVVLKQDKQLERRQKEIQTIVGDRFVVRNKYQQEETLFKTMQSEKLVIFVILAFILLVAAFNIIGSLGILILEKQSNNSVLSSLGAPKHLIQRIFVYEGIMISMLGGMAGLLLGAVICLLQQVFHVVKLRGPGYLLDYYPVEMKLTDFVVVLCTVLIISIVTSVVPAHSLKKSLS